MLSLLGIGAHHARNRCSASPESVLTLPGTLLSFLRNPCSPCVGIGAQLAPEYACATASRLVPASKYCIDVERAPNREPSRRACISSSFRWIILRSNTNFHERIIRVLECACADG